MHSTAPATPAIPIASPAVEESTVHEAGVIRMLVGESSAIYIAGLRSIFDDNTQFDIVGVTASFETLQRLVMETVPSIVLLDESLIGRRADQLLWMVKTCPNTKLIVEVNNEERDFCLSLLQAGVRAVIPRLVDPGELVHGILAVAKGEFWISSAIQQWLIGDWQASRRLALPKFNQRERIVMSLVVLGRKNKDIAAQIGTSEQTIKNTLSRLYARLGVDSREGFRKRCISMGVPSTF
jgi:DNA-binding NarL/FixJ family response regulator